MYFFAFHIKPSLKWIFFGEVLSLTELLVASVISSIISNMPDTQFTQVCRGKHALWHFTFGIRAVIQGKKHIKFCGINKFWLASINTGIVDVKLTFKLNFTVQTLFILYKIPGFTHTASAIALNDSSTESNQICIVWL